MADDVDGSAAPARMTADAAIDEAVDAPAVADAVVTVRGSATEDGGAEAVAAGAAASAA